MTAIYDDGHVAIYGGDCRAVMATLPEASVHVAVTSPPYYGLRDYGTATWDGGDPECDHKAGGNHQQQGATSLRAGRSNVEDQRSDNHGASICGKCGAVRVEPTIWGGDPEHAHEWADASWRNNRWGAHDDEKIGEKQPTNVGALGHRGEKRLASTCECGAWRGALGLEPTPDLYVAHMVEVARAVRRVLRPDGTFWLNLGDSFNNRSVARKSSHQGGLGFTSDDLSKSWASLTKEGRTRLAISDGDLKEKDLIGIPWMVAFALRADGWWLRRDVIWDKPNGMPESVEDRPSSSHEYLFMLTKSARYFYDHVAVKEPFRSGPSDLKKMAEGKERLGGRHRELDAPEMAANKHSRIGTHRGVGDAAAAQAALDKQRQTGEQIIHGGDRHSGFNDRWADASANGTTPGGRNLRSVWRVATEPYPGAHFATWPRKLVEPMIKASTSEHGVCPECGAPWRRMVEEGTLAGEARIQETERPAASHRGVSVSSALRTNGRTWREAPTLGWERTCSHDGEPVPATVLDPFAGSGTTGLVAQSLGRRAILIDLNPEYLKQALARATREWGVGGKILEDPGTAEPDPDGLWAMAK